MNVRLFIRYYKRCKAIGHKVNAAEAKLYGQMFGGKTK